MCSVETGTEPKNYGSYSWDHETEQALRLWDGGPYPSWFHPHAAAKIAAPDIGAPALAGLSCGW